MTVEGPLLSQFKFYEQTIGSDEESLQLVGDHLRYEAGCMKLRRCVIMVIAVNRLKRLASQQSSTCLDEE